MLQGVLEYDCDNTFLKGLFIYQKLLYFVNYFRTDLLHQYDKIIR